MQCFFPRQSSFGLAISCSQFWYYRDAGAKKNDGWGVGVCGVGMITPHPREPRVIGGGGIRRCRNCYEIHDALEVELMRSILGRQNRGTKTYLLRFPTHGLRVYFMLRYFFIIFFCEVTLCCLTGWEEVVAFNLVCALKTVFVVV